MKLGLLVTTYNRPKYLTECIRSLKRANIPEWCEIVFIDDCSTDPETTKLLEESGYEYLSKKKRMGICHSLVNGLDYLSLHKECEILMNLDGDAIVRNDFIQRILELPNNKLIRTGFNCYTKNANGTDRHLITDEGLTARIEPERVILWNEKLSVGGINMCFNSRMYEAKIRNIIINSGIKKLNWDHQVCLQLGGAISTMPSVIQHIGFDSAMNHTEQPDTADDFKYLNLENVTLLGVDCLHIDRLIKAAERSQENIIFGAVKLLSSIRSEERYIHKIKPIKSKEEYSEFMIKELNDYVDTDFVLIIQHDGYVRNANAWRKDFLDYDYIGAVWWHNDGRNVGNGGFSLRSKKLLEACATNKKIVKTHPEDLHIGRTYRKILEKEHGIKFAPESIADQFSVEGYATKRIYTGQFGSHGFKENVNDMEEKTLIINQFRGLGDILFTMPLIESWQEQGHNIIWPVESCYTNIQKHFPHIRIIDKAEFNIDYSTKKFKDTQYGKMVPLRFANEILKEEYKNCMKNKYEMFNRNWREWRFLKWKRDDEAEHELFFNILKLKTDTEYTLVNRNFRTDQSGKSNIPAQSGVVIDMHEIEGFTLLDWGMVIQNASIIHTVGTSINYIMEILELKAKEIHLYVRRPEEKDFSYYDYLLTKEYIYHK